MNELDLFNSPEPEPTPETAPAAAKPAPAKKIKTAAPEPAPVIADERGQAPSPAAAPTTETSETPAPLSRRGGLSHSDVKRVGEEGLPVAGLVCLVTGSSRGIGRGIALELGKQGHSVVVNYAGNQTAADECLQMVKDAGGDGITVQGDVSVETDRERLVQTVLDTYGRIDLLVNNAGVAPNVRADILEAGEESFDRLIGINLKGPYFLTQRVARQMIAQTEQNSDATPGQIITITSVSAYTASTNRGDYCISKAGLGMMTALWAARLAEYGIRVYEIRPGVIATDMTGGVKEKYDKMVADGVWPIKRWGQPDDIGRAVAAIARGDFPFSTGEVFNVDGGFQLRTL